MSDVETRVTRKMSDGFLATLAEIGEEINASLNLDRVLSKMATLIKRLVDYEIFTVMLLDEGSQMLSNRFAVGYSQEMMENWRVPVGQGISGAAAASRQPILVADVRKDPRYINAIDSVRSELAVPLLFKNQVVGVIDIQSSQVDYFTPEQQEILVLLAGRLATAIGNARLFERARSQADTLLLLHEVGREASSIIHRGTVIGVLDLESPQWNYFTEAHAQALSILAAKLAIARENARLYEKVARDEARMERELHAAQRMQGALLRPVPAEDFGVDLAARILSAREVCGDLYDFLRYGPTRIGFGLGDVSGKGSAAALYGAVAIGILRSVAPQKLLPAELLRRLNQLICERRIEGRFMTFCFATWRKPTRKLRMANAGQTQPLLYRNGRCEQLKLVGFPLGIYDDVTYEEWVMNLDPGNILVFHSDGLSEATDPEGTFFGIPRIAALVEQNAALTSDQLADRLLAEVQEFTRGMAITDDRTLVA